MEFHCQYQKLVPAGELQPHPKNYRNHPESQLAKIRAVIATNGWRSPVVVSSLSGYIVKGHGRVEAMDPDQLVPVEEQDYATAEDELRDMVADNEITTLAENDEDKLAAILGELDVDGIDPDQIGLSSPEVDRLLEVLEDNHFLSASDPPEQPEDDSQPDGKDPSLTYTIIFESGSQVAEWQELMANLRERYPDETTMGGCIATHARTVNNSQDL